MLTCIQDILELVRRLSNLPVAREIVPVCARHKRRPRDHRPVHLAHKHTHASTTHTQVGRPYQYAQSRREHACAGGLTYIVVAIIGVAVVATFNPAKHSIGGCLQVEKHGNKVQPFGPLCPSHPALLRSHEPCTTATPPALPPPPLSLASCLYLSLCDVCARVRVCVCVLGRTRRVPPSNEAATAA
jgi:hypothetical protein